jgi:hypothetical protein
MLAFAKGLEAGSVAEAVAALRGGARDDGDCGSREKQVTDHVSP